MNYVATSRYAVTQLTSKTCFRVADISFDYSICMINEELYDHENEAVANDENFSNWEAVR